MAKPRDPWTVDNIYGGSPDTTDPRAYFAFNLGFAWADVVYWAPVQLTGSVGMLMGHRWGLVLGLIGSVPFWYSAVPLLVWDRHMGYGDGTVKYWVLWGLFPAYGILEMVYCGLSLL